MDWYSFSFGVILVLGFIVVFSMMSGWPGRFLLKLRYSTIKNDIEEAQQSVKIGKAKLKKFRNKIQETIGE